MADNSSDNQLTQVTALQQLVVYLDRAVSHGAYNLALTKDIHEMLAALDDKDADKAEPFKKLVNYIDIAFSRGAYNLADAHNIVNLFTPFRQPTEEVPVAPPAKSLEAPEPTKAATPKASSKSKKTEPEFVTI